MLCVVWEQGGVTGRDVWKGGEQVMRRLKGAFKGI